MEYCSCESNLINTGGPTGTPHCPQCLKPIDPRHLVGSQETKQMTIPTKDDGTPDFERCATITLTRKGEMAIAEIAIPQLIIDLKALYNHALDEAIKVAKDAPGIGEQSSDYDAGVGDAVNGVVQAILILKSKTD